MRVWVCCALPHSQVLWCRGWTPLPNESCHGPRATAALHALGCVRVYWGHRGMCGLHIPCLRCPPPRGCLHPGPQPCSTLWAPSLRRRPPGAAAVRHTQLHLHLHTGTCFPLISPCPQEVLDGVAGAVSGHVHMCVCQTATQPDHSHSCWSPGPLLLPPTSAPSEPDAQSAASSRYSNCPSLVKLTPTGHSSPHQF